jgi:peptidoglycan-associated lipoprotein
MNRSALVTTSALLLTLLPISGCARRHRAASPVAEPVAVESTPVVAAPTPVPADEVEDPLEAELAAANDYAYANGLLGDVYFDFDRYALREDARARLARNAEFLRTRPEFVVNVEGHCDERGTNEYNLALGERRAQAAREYLVSLGVDAGRLRSLSYGEERPLCAESGEGCWQRNRRAHFVLVERRPPG